MARGKLTLAIYFRFLAVALLAVVSFCDAATVTTGDVVRIDFNLSGDPGVIVPPDRIQYLMTFGGASQALNPGESLKVNWIEDSSAPSPLLTDSFAPVSSEFPGITGIFFPSGLELVDVAGILTITDVIGTIDLASVVMRTTTGGVSTGYVSQTFTVTAIPVPAAVWLFASAIAGIGFTRKRLNRIASPR